MYCKHCGKLISNDSSFCQFCGWEQTHNDISKGGELKPAQSLNVNGRIIISNDESFFLYIRRIISKNSYVSIGYTIWLLINLVLLISGSGDKHFFPRIYKDDEWHSAGYGGLGHYEEKWVIRWDIDYYGWPEFVIYVFLTPFIIYVLFMFKVLYKDFKLSKDYRKQLLFTDNAYKRGYKYSKNKSHLSHQRIRKKMKSEELFALGLGLVEPWEGT